MSGIAGNIDFAVYPSSNRDPGSFAEVNNSQANTGQANQRALILGQMTSGGTATANNPEISSGLGDAQGKYGLNSIAAQMVQFYRLSDLFGELWVLPLNDDPSADAASGTITPTGPATGAGNIFLYIAASPINPRLAVPVSVAMTVVQIGAAIAAAINAVPTSPVTAVASGSTGVVTVTAVNKGVLGNGIDMRLNYLGAVAGEVLPPGVGITLTGASGGTGTLLAGGSVNPSLTAGLANLSGDQTYDFIVCPYADTASLNAIQAFLNDTAGRWSWQQELFGGAWTAFRGTLGGLAALGNARNDQHTQAIGIYDSPSPDYLWATDVTANSAVSLRANPAVPLQELPLNVFAPPIPSRFISGERNTMLYDGVSTFYVDDSGTVRISRMCTTYQKNAAGAPDNSYLDTETLYTLQFLIRDLRTFITSQFPRKILVVDGTPIPFGSAMVTSKIILGGVNGRYQSYCDAGLAQNAAQFVQQSQAQNAGGGLVKLLLPIQVADQLRQTAMLIQFTKP
jgi:phage tail sheath gpL-like